MITWDKEHGGYSLITGVENRGVTKTVGSGRQKQLPQVEAFAIFINDLNSKTKAEFKFSNCNEGDIQ